MSTTYTLAANKSKMLTHTGSSYASDVSAMTTGVSLYSVAPVDNDHAAKEIAIAFNSLPAAAQYKIIESASFSYQAYYSYTPRSGSGHDATYVKSYGIDVAPLTADFTTASKANDIRWDYNANYTDAYYTRITTSRTQINKALSAGWAKTATQYGVRLRPKGPYMYDTASLNDIINVYVYSEASSYKPQLQVTVGDSNRTMTFKTFKPAAGTSTAPYKSLDFSCTIAADSNISVADPAPASGRIKYRKTGTTAATTVNLPVTSDVRSYSYTMPAGTFTPGSYEYIFEFTLNTGDTISTAWTAFTVTADDRTMTIASAYPTSGSKKAPTSDINISCRLSVDNKGAETKLQVTSCEIQYRSVNVSTYTTITLTPATDVYYYDYWLPAGTLDVGDYVYKFIIVNNRGDVITNGLTRFSVGDTTPKAPTLIAPADEIIDGSNGVTFRWSHNNSSGLPASKADLAYKIAGAETWTNVTDITGSSYTLAAGVLSSGEYTWTARTYNTEGTAGPFAETINFSVIAPPAEPVVSIDNPAPMASITWTSTDQAAYQIELDGVIVYTGFGTTTTWSVKDHLSLSDHTFGVRVQNNYGLWSTWGTAGLQPTNHGSSIALYADKTSAGVLIYWSPDRAPEEFRLYRDGTCIARLEPTTRDYTDDAATGVVKYEIRGCFSSGYYDASNIATLDATEEHNQIKSLETGALLELVYSEVQNRVETISTRRNVQLVHLSGNRYKTAERGEAYEDTITVSCAFPAGDRVNMARLEGMVGGLVLLKTNAGRKYYGVLTKMAVNDYEFFTAYDLTVARVEYSEDIT